MKDGSSGFESFSRWLIGLVVISGLTVLSFLGRGFVHAQEPATSDTSGPAVVEELLKKSERVGPVYFEERMSEFSSSLGESDAQEEIGITRVWMNGRYSREETSYGTWIRHPDATYRYDQERDRYERVDTVPETGLPFNIRRDDIDRAKVIGSAQIDGKLTTIVEFEFPVPPGDVATTKIWYWQETGLPLRAESRVSMGGQAISRGVEEYSNFKFEPIPDTLFEIPEEKLLRH